MKPILNCDLGEGESLTRTKTLLKYVGAANIATGAHAGDFNTIVNTIRAAKSNGVLVGAHPGLPDREGKGRRGGAIKPTEMSLLLAQQVGGFETICRGEMVRLNHIKLHGALYHLCNDHEDFANELMGCMLAWWPKVLLVVRAGSFLSRLVRAIRQPSWPEVFADRAYHADGTLVSRGEPGAVLEKSAEVRARIERYLREGEIVARDGGGFKVNARTICVHSDTANAAILARVAARALEA